MMDDRRERYAAAIEQDINLGPTALLLVREAVMAVADAEQAQLQAENSQLHQWHAEDRDDITRERATARQLRTEIAELREGQQADDATIGRLRVEAARRLMNQRDKTTGRNRKAAHIQDAANALGQYITKYDLPGWNGAVQFLYDLAVKADKE